MSPLLHFVARWNHSSLGMYVDDGLLFACAETWDAVCTLLRVVIGRGNPWVFIWYPYSYPSKPLPLLKGKGFEG
jgi:hypothetical protein